MNIGILTFHWGTNHGAVLQAYALSDYLCKQYSANVEIIDYYPKKYEVNAANTFQLRNLKIMPRKIHELIKENKIKSFRSRLKLSKRFYSNQELIDADLNYDILITGSDQIWNPSFLRGGEGKITPVYFLNFGGAETKKISVSASFGCEMFPLDCQQIALPFLREFQEISVRENTGRDILENMGLDATVAADPTVLLTGEDCASLCNDVDERNIVSKMILRRQSKDVKVLIRRICRTYSSRRIVDIESYSIPDWLTAIKKSKVVITNSFHCVMMCLKLHTPFVVVLEDGQKSGMNDRFKTLLHFLGLSDRIICSSEDIQHVSPDIDFERVDAAMERYAESLKRFLDRNVC